MQTRDSTRRRPPGPRSIRSRLRAALVGGALLSALGPGAAASRIVVEDPSLIARTAARVRLVRLGGVLLGTEGVVLQGGPYECGPASLGNLLGRLGRHVPPTDSLAELAGTTAAGTSAAGLQRAARSLGLDLRFEVRPAGEIDDLQPPYIAWVGGHHFVTVVERRPDREHVVLDPQVGAVRLSPAALRSLWSGAVLRPSPGPTSPAGA